MPSPVVLLTITDVHIHITLVRNSVIHKDGRHMKSRTTTGTIEEEANAANKDDNDYRCEASDGYDRPARPVFF